MPRTLLVSLTLLTCAGAAPAQGKITIESRVFGTVVNSRGEPVDGAEVRAVRSAFAGTPPVLADWYLPPRSVDLASTRTDARGRFELRVDPSLPFGLRVGTADGSAIGGVGAPIPPFSALEVRVRPVAELRGRVVATPADVPLPASLEVSGYVDDEGANPRPWRTGSVPVGADGSFALMLPRGVNCFVHPGSPLGKQAVRLPEDGPVDSLELSLPLRVVRGRLTTGANRRPLAGATVHGCAATVVRAGADGRFEIVIQPDAGFRIEAPDHASTYAQAPADDGDADLEIRRASTVRGRLVDVDGEPLAQSDIVALRMAEGPTGSGVGLVESRTDDDGRFALDGLAPWTGVTAWARGADRFVRILDVPKGDADVDLGEVQLASGAIPGVVLDAHGVPAAHVPIYAQVDDDVFGSRFGLGQWPVTTTNHAGQFVVRGILPGRGVQIVAIGPESFPAIAHAIARPEAPARIELRLQAAPLFEGQLVDADGEPVAGRWVFASAYGSVDPVLESMALWSSETRTDAGGRFRLPARTPDVVHEIGSGGAGEKLRLMPGATGIELEVEAK